MRTPASVGLPSDKFPEWRRGQYRVLRDATFADERFIVLCLPTGSGKSAIGMGYAGFNEDQRIAYLTATRQLQDQLQDDFDSTGIVDIRGRDNYTCNVNEHRTAATADCTAGVFCSLMREGGCDYFDLQRQAAANRTVLTNYRKWLTDEDASALGKFSVVIADEGHKAPDEISEFAAVEVTVEELAKFRVPEPPYKRKPRALGQWAVRAGLQLERAAEGEKRITVRRQIKSLARKLTRLCRLGDQEWLQQGGRTYGGWRWDLIDPGALAEDLLFRGARRVILVSATIRRKTLDMLGVPRSAVKVIEQDSSFPVRRRPVYYWPVARMGQKTGWDEKKRWLQAHDEFISPRLDRKGLIHPHSYDRGLEIYRASRYRERMILHQRGQKLSEVLARFDAMPAGGILVSPAIGEGVDFKGRRAEWQIISKVPFPDFRSPLIKARQQRDREYPAYLTLQKIAQIIGRVVRANDDQGETVILDGHLGWLRSAHWDFWPRSVHAAVRTVDPQSVVPPPPPPL